MNHEMRETYDSLQLGKRLNRFRILCPYLQQCWDGDNRIRPRPPCMVEDILRTRHDRQGLGRFDYGWVDSDSRTTIKRPEEVGVDTEGMERW